MRLVLRFLLLTPVLLVSAAVTPAQKFIAHVSSPQSSSRGPYPSAQGGGWYGHDIGFGYSEHGHRGHGGRSSSPAFEPTIGYAHGEPSAIASTYMDYDQALALGKQMLEAESHPALPPAQPSLGEIARELRQASGAPAASGKLLAIQDGQGQLVICRDGGCQ